MSEMLLLRKNMYDKMIIFRFASKNAFSPIICRFEDLQKPRFIEVENFSQCRKDTSCGQTCSPGNGGGSRLRGKNMERRAIKWRGEAIKGGASAFS